MGTKLRSFQEAVLGSEVRVFGNVAVALAACEMTENGSEAHRTVEMLLLIKNEGAWRIVGQAWDTEGPSKQITHGIDQLRAGARGNSRPDYFWP